jgi:transposase-like protein
MGRNNRRPDASIIRAAITASASLEEAASRLNCHRTTLWRWLRDLELAGEPIEVRRSLAA